jgi:hypothetical protein
VIEIDPALVDPSPIADRLPVPLEFLQDHAVEVLDVVNGEIEQLRNAWGRARKNLLAGLTGEKLTAVNSETSSMAGDLAKAMSAPFANFTDGGAIGAVSRSIEQIKQQVVIEIDPALIDPSPAAKSFCGFAALNFPLTLNFLPADPNQPTLSRHIATYPQFNRVPEVSPCMLPHSRSSLKRPSTTSSANMPANCPPSCKSIGSISFRHRPRKPYADSRRPKRPN